MSQEQPRTDQFKTTLQQFHIRMKKERAKEQAFVRSLLVVFLLTVLCFLPMAITKIIPLINPDFVVTIDFALSVTLVLFFNCSVNWIVYGVMNRSFRRRYVTLVRRLLCMCCRVSLSKISVDRLLQERARRQYFRNV
nr:hypothetical protein BaRGS_034561 [Batillaria attramentaria]